MTSVGMTSAAMIRVVICLTLVCHKIFCAGVLKVGIEMTNNFLFLPIKMKKKNGGRHCQGLYAIRSKDSHVEDVTYVLRGSGTSISNLKSVSLSFIVWLLQKNRCVGKGGRTNVGAHLFRGQRS